MTMMNGGWGNPMQGMNQMGMNPMSMMQGMMPPGMQMPNMPNEQEIYTHVKGIIHEYLTGMFKGEMPHEVKEAFHKAIKRELKSIDRKEDKKEDHKEESDEDEDDDEKKSPSHKETHPMEKLYDFVGEMQECIVSGVSMQEVGTKVREKLGGSLSVEEMKVIEQLIKFDGVSKHASAVGMTVDEFKKHLRVLADKL